MLNDRTLIKTPKNALIFGALGVALLVGIFVLWSSFPGCRSITQEQSYQVLLWFHLLFWGSVVVAFLGLFVSIAVREYALPFVLQMIFTFFIARSIFFLNDVDLLHYLSYVLGMICFIWVGLQGHIRKKTWAAWILTAVLLVVPSIQSMTFCPLTQMEEVYKANAYSWPIPMYSQPIQYIGTVWGQKWILGFMLAWLLVSLIGGTLIAISMTEARPKRKKRKKRKKKAYASIS